MAQVLGKAPYEEHPPVKISADLPRNPVLPPPFAAHNAGDCREFEEGCIVWLADAWYGSVCGYDSE